MPDTDKLNSGFTIAFIILLAVAAHYALVLYLYRTLKFDDVDIGPEMGRARSIQCIDNPYKI